MSEPTLILDGRIIAELIDPDELIDAVERAFEHLARGTMVVPPVVHLAVPGGAFHVKSAAFLGDRAQVAVKVNGNFPGNPERTGLPTIQGAILLCDGGNGFPLAILDSIEITALRTGAATAVAARHLARRNVERATIIGCGRQAAAQLRSLARVLPLRRVWAFDLDRGRAADFASTMTAETGIEVGAIDDFAEGTRSSSVIVTCTTARRAFLEPGHVGPGTLIAAVGADNDDKQELAPALLARARVVVDELEQCARIGELHHALAAGAMTVSNVVADLGAVVAGNARVARADDDIVVFDSTGLAIQDVAAAGIVHARARERGLGIAVALG